MHATRDFQEKDVDELKKQASLADELGFDATFENEVPVAGLPLLKVVSVARRSEPASDIVDAGWPMFDASPRKVPFEPAVNGYAVV